MFEGFSAAAVPFFYTSHYKDGFKLLAVSLHCHYAFNSKDVKLEQLIFLGFKVI